MLAALALGLPAFVLIKVFHPGFFAREDTKTPMLYAGIGMAANIGLGLMLFVILGAVGLALATSVAGWLQVALLAGTLKAREDFALDTTFRRRFPGICGASLLMGSVVGALAYLLKDLFAPGSGLVLQVGALLLLIGSGLIAYALSAQALGAVALKPLLQSLRRP
jgi:putative peptidoglycan lipid II flippase